MATDVTVFHLLGDPVFLTSDRTFAFSDVVAAATFWGDWQRLESRVRQDFACASALRPGRAFTTREVDDEATRFRYDRNLLAAEELEAWLEGWRLSMGDWLDHIRRLVARPYCGGSGSLVGAPDPRPEVVARATLVEAICTGELGRFAHKLAGRAAVFAHFFHDPDSDPKAPAVADRAKSAHSNDPLAGDAAVESELAQAFLEGFESAFERFTRAAVTPAALAERVSQNQQAWTRVDGTWLLFAAEDRAKEGAVALREDGEAAEAVCAASGASMRRGAFYLDDLEPELRTHARSASCGVWSGPAPVGGRFAVSLVREKTPPVIGDAEVRRRAERAIVHAAVEREIATRVTWCRRLDT